MARLKDLEELVELQAKAIEANLVDWQKRFQEDQ